MKNLFEKKDDTTLITVLTVAAVAAGGLSYLYFTRGGLKTRKAISHKLKDEAKNLASGFISGKTGISKKTVKKVADFFVK